MYLQTIFLLIPLRQNQARALLNDVAIYKQTPTRQTSGEAGMDKMYLGVVELEWNVF